MVQEPKGSLMPYFSCWALLLRLELISWCFVELNGSRNVRRRWQTHQATLGDLVLSHSVTLSSNSPFYSTHTLEAHVGQMHILVLLLWISPKKILYPIWKEMEWTLFSRLLPKLMCCFSHLILFFKYTPYLSSPLTSLFSSYYFSPSRYLRSLCWHGGPSWRF